jgi:DNA-binding response OmpR family regulator
MTRSVILLVEDEASIRNAVKAVFNTAGFEVVVARNGIEAMAELDADGRQFKAVVTDIQLGSGPDGWAIGRRARELVADMPVIYMSGNGGNDWSSKGVPDSVMVAKPFATVQLITAVSTLITKADTRRQAPPETA